MSRQAFPTQLRDNLKNEVRLAPKPFAVGGEGAVFDVLNRPDLVAKLYSKPQSKERCDKLRAMAKLCSPDLLKIAAWPTATLNVSNPAIIDGILMPRIADYLEIHHLYSVAQRKKDFPEADWGFLLHTARNCAIAFEAVHGHGHVVGDVNQKNVMVSKKGIVAFVDCDSFQVTDGSRIFRCGVGVPEYTPPELHGKNFASLDRAANHDLFGLAVLVFHLLMMGRHPFSGVPLIKADIPIEKAIQDGCYAYTRNTMSARLKPPPHVPPITMLGSSVLDLFDRAFRTARRPTATEWRTSLDTAMSQLVRCKNDPRHSYMTVAGQCPWCELIATARLMFFLPKQGSASTPFRPEDLQTLLNKLAGMQLLVTPYTRSQPILSISIALPSGLRPITPKPLPKPHPFPPPPVQRPLLTAHPFVPQPQKPSLKPHPQPPVISPAPALKPHPPVPSDPPRPKLKTIPLPPVHPPLPPLTPPDPFLSRLCIVGIIGGLCVVFVAKPVGFLMIVVFSLWWVLMLVTEAQRQQRSRAAVENAHQLECDQMDEEYAELCNPIEEENQRLKATWKAWRTALAAEYDRSCRKVDDENRRQLAPWEALKAAREEDHQRKSREIDQENCRQIAALEAEYAVRAELHERSCKTIDAANRHLIAAWEASTASRAQKHEQACKEIDAMNQRLLAAWEAINAPWLAEEKRLKQQAVAVKAEIKRLEDALYGQCRASVEQFERKKKEVESVVSAHSSAIQQYEKDLRQAEEDTKKFQMEEYLDKFLIRRAKLQGITNERVLSLESFGIQTANDVTMLNTQKVPGIGPVLSNRLFAWRNSLAAGFAPKQTLPEAERNFIASRFAPVFLPLAQTLQTAIRDLQGLGESHRTREREMIKTIGTFVQTAASVEAHLDALNKLM